MSLELCGAPRLVIADAALLDPHFLDRHRLIIYKEVVFLITKFLVFHAPTLIIGIL